jgi:pimeloyl-ACP methyl ester carboxylesterase
VVELAATRLAGSAGAGDLLVAGPSLGTAVEVLWARCAPSLAPRFEVVGWDLPGHGRSRPASGAFAIADLASAVRDLALAAADGRAVWYAGVSLSGAVGLELALDPGPFEAVAVITSAPRIGDARAWRERADLVRRAGTPAMVPASAVRWFAPGFPDREPAVAGALLASLSGSDRFSYSFACEALAEFDLRARVAEVKVPLLVAAGEHDQVVGPDEVRGAVPGATFAVLPGCGHLPPAEDPAAVAALLTTFFGTQRGAR